MGRKAAERGRTEDLKSSTGRSDGCIQTAQVESAPVRIKLTIQPQTSLGSPPPSETREAYPTERPGWHEKKEDRSDARREEF